LFVTVMVTDPGLIVNTFGEILPDHTGTRPPVQAFAGTANSAVFSLAEQSVPAARLKMVCDDKLPVPVIVSGVVTPPQTAFTGNVQPDTLPAVLLMTTFFTMRSPTG
jgi:hypothetical protein